MFAVRMGHWQCGIMFLSGDSILATLWLGWACCWRRITVTQRGLAAFRLYYVGHRRIRASEEQLRRSFITGRRGGCRWCLEIMDGRDANDSPWCEKEYGHDEATHSLYFHCWKITILHGVLESIPGLMGLDYMRRWVWKSATSWLQRQRRNYQKVNKAD